MVVEAEVKGVKGAASRPAEALIFFLGWESSLRVEDIVASAAFRFRVRGGMVPAYRELAVCRTGLDVSDLVVILRGRMV